MPATVVDASALAAVVFSEPDAAKVAPRLDAAERVVAPGLVWFELANTCWKKIQRDARQREWLLERFSAAADLPVEVAEIDHRAAVELACEAGLTAYDASYLWLARHLGAELVTLDDRLRAASGNDNGASQRG